LEETTIVVEVGVYKGGLVKLISKVLLQEGVEALIFASDVFPRHVVVDERLEVDHTVNAELSDIRLNNIRSYSKEYKTVRITTVDMPKIYSEIPNEQNIDLLVMEVDLCPTANFYVEQLGPNASDGGFIVCDDSDSPDLIIYLGRILAHGRFQGWIHAQITEKVVPFRDETI
jgi:hypothetical protein